MRTKYLLLSFIFLVPAIHEALHLALCHLLGVTVLEIRIGLVSGYVAPINITPLQRFIVEDLAHIAMYGLPIFASIKHAIDIITK